MAEDAATATAERRPQRTGVALSALLVAALLGGLAVSVAYGFTSEYGDTSAARSTLFVETLVAWIPAYLVVGLVLAGAVAARRDALFVGAAGGILALTVLGIPVAAVLGVEAKYERYDATPGCDGPTDTGPLQGRAQRVLERAEKEFAAIDHPGPFTGGGSSGIGGCESGLVLRPGEDPVAAYQVALPAVGWTLVHAGPDTVRAEKDDEAFRLRMSEGEWRVWIGPA